ncbi:hydrogenase large subunit [Alicyclobacillus sp. ALC3]|uniref:hydrogenase large subunit n=1 Tax=Alicyclobacillus sp. ALC3 TaxID=2796143 RepID=UPI0023782822|nr:NADH-quinone oxidoreductase subunit C [Alicyclobacillus sp. ALC3]WDL99776.1 NADH-quinone oxidoreductase subunit C [Alicyclobacillus sp. ALC3]
MYKLPNRDTLKATSHDVYQANSLSDFSKALLQYCRSDGRADGAPLWQLLYYGAIREQEKNSLLAVLAQPGTGEELWIAAALSDSEPWPSLANDWPALLWPEREAWERTGFEPLGHPDLVPLLQPHRFELQGRAQGAGVFSLPLGPVRADVSESGFFMFDTVGEQIMHMQLQLFYKHRGVEQLAIGQPIDHVLLISERISGTATASHACAYVTAVERAIQWRAPVEIQRERQLWIELERMYNYAHDLSQLASAAGMTVGQAQLARVKEECLRLAGGLSGSRYLRGSIQLFRASGLDWKAVMPTLESRLLAIDKRFARFVRLLRRTPSFVDRLVGTGIVNRAWVDEYGLVGPTARACGITTDVRNDFPPKFQNAGYEVCTAGTGVGDAKARFDVRVAEWHVSVAMVRHLASELANANPRGACVAIRAQTEGWGVGTVEGPRGRIAHVVAVEDGRVKFFGVRSASSWIWPVFGLATANGNIQTDFPVIDASLGLSYAGVDR